MDIYFNPRTHDNDVPGNMIPNFELQCVVSCSCRLSGHRYGKINHCIHTLKEFHFNMGQYFCRALLLIRCSLGTANQYPSTYESTLFRAQLLGPSNQDNKQNGYTHQFFSQPNRKLLCPLHRIAASNS